jgi:hypothetical protein
LRRFFARGVTWCTVRTLVAFLTLWTFTRFTSLLWGLFVGRVVMLSCWGLVGMLWRTFFTWCAVATLAAVTAVTVA